MAYYKVKENTTTLSIPQDLFNELKEVADKQFITVTAFIKLSLLKKLKEE